MKLRRLAPEDVRRAARPAVPEDVRDQARAIVHRVRDGGEPALRECAEKFDGLPPGAPLLAGRKALAGAWEALEPGVRGSLERAHRRIFEFAAAQRACLSDLDVPVEGGRAGHRFVPVDSAGCYVPGGRYPLPSSALMGCAAARAAGVAGVFAATPRAHAATLAAMHAAGADGVLLAGGAHAVAALAYGVVAPRCDVVVGPGNVWVTAAKQAVYGESGIDMLAGPSEVVVLADASADPAWIAADMLAQAEHDARAEAWLVTPHAPLVDEVEAELGRQVEGLPTSDVALAGLANGGAVVCDDLEGAVECVNLLAPEHLEVCLERPDMVAGRLRHFGAAFLGGGAAEVFGDYGAGPNHTLPTGGTARFSSGLSVLHFLRCQTWLRLDDPGALVEDTARLARAEGLEAHARAAEARTRRSKP